MAGRGTDIQLGGHFEMTLAEEKVKNPNEDEKVLADRVRSELEKNKEIVKQAGGLYVLGSERHESRRIDNQLRGRSGRQGDPGLSKFYVSLDDDLMRIFGSERIGNILKTMGMSQGQAIVHPWISKAIAKAQEKVEGFHFDARKTLLEYDGVMNDQRKVIYEQRRELMGTTNIDEVINGMREDCVQNLVYGIAPDKSAPEDWNADDLYRETARLLALDVPFKSWVSEPGITPETMIERLCSMSQKEVEDKMLILPDDIKNDIKRSIVIQSIDQCWREHLQTLDFLKSSIGLRGYGQQNPLNAYKQEAFILFEGLLSRVRERVVRLLAYADFQLKPAEPKTTVETGKQNPEPETPKNISRNAPCPCGSGKKYKHCCGKLS
jgi:preprotein translocase subunit SecA